jgi:hypothetical protein
MKLAPAMPGKKHDAARAAAARAIRFLIIIATR